MTRIGSDYQGPGFLSDLIRDMAHLRQQQEGMEAKMSRLNSEHERCSRRLDAIESTLRAIGCRETDLVADITRREAAMAAENAERDAKALEEAALAKGRMLGQRALLAALVPVGLLFAGWFLSLVWFAVIHAERDEPVRLRQESPPQMGPPVPERLRRP